MEDAVKTTRKRQSWSVMDNDNSTSEQPILKFSKIEEQAVPPAEVVAEPAERRHDSNTGESMKDGFQAEKKGAVDLEIRLAEVLVQLEEARGKVNELTLENKALKTELAETKQVQQERIDELTGKLAHCEDHLMQLQLQAMDMHEGEDTTAANDPSLLNNKELQTVCHPNNIFQLCSPDANQSTSLKKARKKFFDIAESARRFPLITKRDLIRVLVNQYLASSPQTLLSSLHCVACGLLIDERDVIDHFISKGHQAKASYLGAAVSNAAVTYWVKMLKSAAQSKKQSAAAAATPKVGGASKEIKMEEDND